METMAKSLKKHQGKLRDDKWLVNITKTTQQLK